MTTTDGAILNGIPFFIDPSSIEWSYNVKLATTPTVGGKVVQLFGWTMSDLVLSGSFGKDGPERQASFFQLINTIAERQAPTVGANGAQAASPVRFLWPKLEWDFWVFIKEFKQEGASVSIEATPQMYSPRYTLTLVVDEDNGSIVRATASSAMQAYMERLSAGLGWAQSEWNGPVREGDLQSTLQGKSWIDYAYSKYGLDPASVTLPVWEGS